MRTENGLFMKFGCYKIEEQIGCGAFSKVYRGVNEENATPSAVKVLVREQFTDEELTLLSKEGNRVLDAGLDRCPHLVSIYSHGETDSYIYIVTELIEGQTLKQWMEIQYPDQRPSFRQIARLIASVAEGLAYSHQRGVIHRDLKPSNIMLRNSDLSPIIVDFGCGISAGEAAKAVRGILGAGTPLYMAPEQALDPTSTPSAASDIYSLGLIFHELLTGNHPFRNRLSLTQIVSNTSLSEDRHWYLFRTFYQSVESPRASRSEIPHRLAAICMRCLSLDPHQRYPSASDVAQDLRCWLWHRRATHVALIVGPFVLAVIIVVALSYLPLTGGPQNIFKSQIAYDNFDDQRFSERLWKFVRPTVVKIRSPAVAQPDVQLDHGRLILTNRGYLISRDEFPDGVSIEFQWMWTDGRKSYCDDLTVAVRTSGTHRGAWPHEVDDGIAIRFCPEQKTISILDQFTMKPIDFAVGLKMDRNEWHNIRITDDNQTISIYLNNMRSPKLSVTTGYTSGKHCIALYNREAVGGINKESVIDDLAISVPSAKDTHSKN